MASNRFVDAPAPSGGDDYTALNNLITTSSGSGIIIMLQNGVYQVSQPLNLPQIEIHGANFIYGAPSSTVGTTIRALGAIDSVVVPGAVAGSSPRLSNVTIDAGGVATYAAHFKQCSYGEFFNVWFRGALADGVRLDGAYLNDGNRFVQCFITDNGVIYGSSGYSSRFSGYNFKSQSGTAATTSGNTTITFTGAPDLTTLGLRDGDFIITSGGGTIQFMQVVVTPSFGGSPVTPTTVTVANQRPPRVTLSGQDWAISRGDGYRGDLSQTVGINNLYSGLYRANAGAGIQMMDFYAARMRDIQPDGNGFYGIALSLATNQNVTVAPDIRGVYFEGGGNLAADVWIGCPSGLELTGVVGGTFHAPGGVTGNAWFRGQWSLPVFANNAAAIAGGYTSGAFYRTGADPDTVCVVH